VSIKLIISIIIIFIGNKKIYKKEKEYLLPCFTKIIFFTQINKVKIIITIIILMINY